MAFLKPDTPKPPDPKDTSAAATGTSVATAIANAQLNNVNQVGPDGTLSYNNTGNYTWTDPFTKETYTVPKTTVTKTLSPTQQAIADQENKTKLNLGTLAADQSGFLHDYMATPFDGSNDATEARLMELGRKRLDPMLAQRHDALLTSLSNQGIKGGEAYDRALKADSESANDAYNQLLLGGHGQAFSEGQAIRNQPINEITALQSGSQVSQPTFGSYSQGSIPTTDNAGLINNNFSQKMAGYNANMNSFNDIAGGLFGLGKAAIMASDRRLKKDIIRIGKALNGLPWYAFRYMWEAASAPFREGFMSDDVRKVKPHAVIVDHKTGFDMVDYDLAMET